MRRRVLAASRAEDSWGIVDQELLKRDNSVAESYNEILEKNAGVICVHTIKVACESDQLAIERGAARDTS